MRKSTPESEAATAWRRAAAHLLLVGLLRTSKTRAGLIAAANTKGVTAHFVYGYLSSATLSGEVIKTRTGSQVLYRLASCSEDEPPEPSIYPEWLEPRTLPPYYSRCAHYDAQPQFLLDKP